MNKSKFKNTLGRWLGGTSNETENALVDAWYRSYTDSERDLNDDQHQHIKQNLLKNLNAAIGRRKIYQMPIFRMAACLAVVLTGGVIFLLRNNSKHQAQPEFYTVETGTGGMKQVILPDSSVIWLNSLSRVRVPFEFKPATREVDLLEGEAFFDVKHKPTQPFTVHVQQLNVQVLGTSFNIRNYRSLKHITVTVASGKVGVISNHQTLGLLLPGQQLTWNVTTRQYQQQTVPMEQAQGWRTGNTYLTQVSFKEIAMVINNIYGVSLKPGSPEVDNYRFTLRLQHSLPVDQALKVICQIHNTHYRKEGNEVVVF